MKRGNTNMLSAHIGRSLTFILTILVAAITASALWTGGGIMRRATVRICILEHEPSSRTAQRYETLRTVLSGAMHRTVTITAVSDALEPGFDMYILPAFDWLRLADELHIVPVCGVAAGDERTEAVLLVAGAERESIDYAALSAGDIAFGSLQSVGSFWAQASMLHAGGFRLPARLDEFRFAGNNSNGCERAVLAVVSGSSALGTCSEAVLSALIERGIVDAGRLRVVARSPVIPKTIIASARESEASVRKQLREIRSALERAERAEGANPARSNPRIEELTPETRRILEETMELARRYRGQF